MSGCGGGDFQNLVTKLFPDEESTSSTNPADNKYSNYKLVTNAEALIASSNTSAISIGILDDGFNPDHLVARGLGKSHPKYPNTPDQGFKNRRVDIEYVTERKAFKTGYRTETKTVRTGTRRVVAGFKNVPAGVKNVLIDNGRPGTPRVIWRTEVIPTSPAWIKRALHNNIRHNTSVNTYQTTAGSAPANQAPVAVNDKESIQCSTSPIIIDVLGNDRDADGDALTIKSVGNGQFGTTKIENGMVVYTPNANACGKQDSFDYTISDGKGHEATATVTIDIAAAPNKAPVAVDDSATTEQGTPVALNTLANDKDPDGDTLTITSVEDPAHGTAEIVNGQIVYTPDADFFGTETFEYTISDGNGGTATATETVIVTQTTPTNTAPVAVNDTESIECSTSPVTIDVLANDSDIDGDTLTITNVANGQYGTTKIVNGMVVYTPNGNGCGKTDSFTYTITDGNGHEVTATVTVNIADQKNTAPVAVDDSATTEQGQMVALNTLANDSDPDGDALTITSVETPAHGTAEIVNGQIVYTPDADFVGTETFEYTISDGNGGTATATETVAVDGSSTSSYDSSTGVLSLGIPTGATGATGEDSTVVGPAGTLTVGTVSTGLEGTDVTITNIGTTSAAIFDITIPKGDTGAGSTEVGPDGDSAYTVAVTNGFSGNEAAWLTSLVSTAVGPAAATYDVTGTVLTITT